MPSACILPKVTGLSILGSMNKWMIFALLSLWATPVVAQDATLEAYAPDVYSRMTITLIPKPETKPVPPTLPKPQPLPMEKQKETDKSEKGKLYTKEELKKKEEIKPTRVDMPEEAEKPAALPDRTPIPFNVEVKLPDVLNQDDFFSHPNFAEHEGLMLYFDPPATFKITPTQIISTADIIFINEDGFITKIAPDLNLIDLSEPIPSGKPVRAVLYINPGSVQKDRIVIGDKFQGPIFKTHPFVIQ